MEKAIKELKEKGLKEYIRIKEELDKEAILKNPAIAKGLESISIRQDEIFFVKPAEISQELFRTKGGRKIKKNKQHQPKKLCFCFFWSKLAIKFKKN